MLLRPLLLGLPGLLTMGCSTQTFLWLGSSVAFMCFLGLRSWAFPGQSELSGPGAKVARILTRIQCRVKGRRVTGVWDPGFLVTHPQGQWKHHTLWLTWKITVSV